MFHSASSQTQNNKLSALLFSFQGTIAFPHPETAFRDIPRTGETPTYKLPRRGFFTEIVNFDELMSLKDPWDDLAARALEPNVFLEPAFAIPLFQHCEAKKELRFLLAWSQEKLNAPHQLIGLLPIRLPGLLSCFARSPSQALAPLGTPLFDRTHGADALHDMIQWLGEHHPRVKGLIVPFIPKHGPTFAMLQRETEAANGKLRVFKEHERAVLSKEAGSGEFPLQFISAKRRNNYRQQRRRLMQSGEVTYRTITNPIDIKHAAEAFLSLEFKGWKGVRRTALLANSSETVFFRAMMRLMAHEGKCRIHTLDLGGTPIAIGIVLESGSRNFYWKTTYDERFAHCSPGVQLTLELTQTQLDSASVSLTDSCAVPNHPMIDHIWRERMTMADVLLPMGNHRGLPFTIGVWRETAYGALRNFAKAAVKRTLNVSFLKPLASVLL